MVLSLFISYTTIPLAGTLAETKGQIRRICQDHGRVFQQNYAKSVPPVHANKPYNEVFYIPMHAVSLESSRMTQLRVVFDASAKTTMGDSLNDQPSRSLQEGVIVCLKKESNSCQLHGHSPVSWKLIGIKTGTSVSQLSGRPKVLIKGPLQKLSC